MSDLDDSMLYNIGLAIYDSLDNDAISPEDIMDSDTEDEFSAMCEKHPNFEKDFISAVKATKNEYEEAVNINEKDYENSKDFFQAKEAVEKKVLEKLKLNDKLKPYIS